MHIALLLTLLAAPAPAHAGAPALYDQLCDRVAASFDSARGGYVGGKGVPDEAAVELSLRRSREKGSDAWRERALTTVQWMHGLRDVAGGGYFHHAGAADPSQPFFDKRTDSNARRMEVMLLAWRVTGTDSLRGEAAMVADYFDRLIMDPAGGFKTDQAADRSMLPDLNGIAARAWLEWAAATGNPRHRDFAFKTLDLIWDRSWSDQGGLVRRPQEKFPRLTDQASMGRACVLASHVGRRPRDLKRARLLGDLLLARFEDTEKGGFRARSEVRANGKVAPARVDISENANAVRFLYELAGLTGDQRYRHAADRAVARFERKLEKTRSGAADWALALRAARHTELTEAPAWASAAEEAPPRQPRVMRFGKTRGR